MRQKCCANQGFSAVELLITLIIAVLFLASGYGLYNFVTKSSGEIRTMALAGQTMNDYLEQYKASADKNCVAKTLASNQSVTVDGLTNVIINANITCPSPSLAGLSRVNIELKYDYDKETNVISTSYERSLTPVSFKSISAGASHTCAIASDNQAYCWGYNGSGQLGNNSTTNSSVPVAVSTSGGLSGKTIKSISAGKYHTCAIASDNQAYCWGDNAFGQLGNNSTTTSKVPVAVNTSGVLSGKTIKSISAGGGHTCAIANNNFAYCWGYNNRGQLGNNSTTNSSIPVAVSLSSKTLKSISAEEGYTCAIANDDKAYCWGWGGMGAFANGSHDDSLAPIAALTSGTLSSATIKSTSGDNYQNCAIANDNQAYCWGHNSLLGSSTSVSSVPVAVDTSGVLNGKTIKSISTGYTSTCAIANDDQVYCWGGTPWGSGSTYGQLGNNSTSFSSVPVAVDTSGVLNGKTIKSISTGSYHTCVIANDNEAYCWGYGVYGQLGNNSTTNSSVPVAVTLPF